MKWIDTMRGKGPLGKLTAWFIVTVLSNSLTWAAVLAAITTAWSFTRNLALQPWVQVLAGAFLFFLWSWAGALYLWDRRRPRVTIPYQDYAYGLTYEDLIPSIDLANKDEALNFGIGLRNFSPSPIRYLIKDIDVRIDTRAMPKMEPGKLTAVMPRGGGRVSSAIPFKYDDIKEYIGKRVNGTLDCKIIYGHPEKSPVRQLQLSLKLTMQIAEGGPHGVGTVRFGGDILKEVDSAIES